MNNLINFFTRHAIWLALGVVAILFLNPGIEEIKTLLLITAVECLAIALSGIAVYVYTKIDFTSYEAMHCLGWIFLGVHICVGLVVLGVYIAQFA
ncbi:MAG: hypothetical protein HW421_3787 [Ignavibacteria bacterium]|nr:hypothetical protein [Ignavibacteria bacterium]